MADSIDELFDCFDEGGTDNDDDKNIKTENDEKTTNRYVTIFLTCKTR